MELSRGPVTQMPSTLRPKGVKPQALDFQAANFQMLGMREEQQDAFALVNALNKEKAARKGLLAVIADGMGGMEKGGECARQAVETLIDVFQESEQADMAFFSKYLYSLSTVLFRRYEGQSGCTLVMALVQDDKLYWISVGDSSVYLMRSGRLTKLNTAHNMRTALLQEQLENHAPDRELLDRNPDGPRLTSFLGMEELAQPEFTKRPLRLCSGDTLLLCSDGVDGVVDEKSLCRLLVHSPQEACEQLQKEIETFNSPVQDNSTALIIQFQAAEEESV